MPRDRRISQGERFRLRRPGRHREAVCGSWPFARRRVPREHRRRVRWGSVSANLAQERKLRQSQGEHKSALLPLGSEVAGIPRIEQETKIVAMRTSCGWTRECDLVRVPQGIDRPQWRGQRLPDQACTRERLPRGSRRWWRNARYKRSDSSGNASRRKRVSSTAAGTREALEGIELGIAAATLEEGVALTETAVVVSQGSEVSGRGGREGDV